MMGDRKKAVTAILGPDSQNIEERNEDGEPGDMHAIAQELIDAVHTKSVPDVVAALRAAITCCDVDEPEEE